MLIDRDSFTKYTAQDIEAFHTLPSFGQSTVLQIVWLIDRFEFQPSEVNAWIADSLARESPWDR